LHELQLMRFNRHIRPFPQQVPLSSPETRLLDPGCGTTCPARTAPGRKTWFLDPLLKDYKPAFDELIPAGIPTSDAREDTALYSAHFDLVIAIDSADHFRAPWPGALRDLQETRSISADRAHPDSLSRQRIGQDLRDAPSQYSEPVPMDSHRDRRELIWACQPTPR